MRKIPRWAFSTVVVAGLSWAGADYGLLPASLKSIAAVGGVVQPTASAAAAREDRYGSTTGFFRVATVERRRIVDSVQATGSITPVALVSVSSQVSGQIKEIYADFNQELRRGDPIALIDPLSFGISVEQAEAQVGIARASVAKAEVVLREATDDQSRKIALAGRGAGTRAEEDRAKANRDLAAADLDDANHQLAGAQAALKQAQADLDRTTIRSPVDGTVIVRNVEIGSTVAVSLQAPVLFTIAQDLRQMQVNISIPEAEIGRILVGQRMEFSADTYSGRTFKGEIVQIRKQPQTMQNVVTYTVVASAPNLELLLLPGMTATARVIIDDTDDKLSVPTAALRFRPPDEPRSLNSRVFVERDGRPTEVPVGLGPSEGPFTAVNGGGLKEGDKVITGLSGGSNRTAAESRGGLLGMF